MGTCPEVALRKTTKGSLNILGNLKNRGKSTDSCLFEEDGKGSESSSNAAQVLGANKTGKNPHFHSKQKNTVFHSFPLQFDDCFVYNEVDDFFGSGDVLNSGKKPLVTMDKERELKNQG